MITISYNYKGKGFTKMCFTKEESDKWIAEHGTRIDVTGITLPEEPKVDLSPSNGAMKASDWLK